MCCTCILDGITYCLLSNGRGGGDGGGSFYWSSANEMVDEEKQTSRFCLKCAVPKEE